MPVHSSPHFPFISIVLVVRDEELHLEQKLRNLKAIHYPAEKTEIIVVSDGSTDGTNRALSMLPKHFGVQTLVLPRAQGKASGLNLALKSARGEIVVFTDARQTIAEDAVLRLMENFADPGVGCASGELTLGDPISGETDKGLGIYWKIEKFTREIESAVGSVVGATGAFYAVRRSLLVPLPPEIVLDDVFIPMQVVRQGARVVFDSRAKMWDLPDLGNRREFSRKVRTLNGIYQLLQLEPWLLTKTNPIRFQFVSHKVLRLAVPFALCAALVSSIFLRAPIYRLALVAQLTFYSLSVGGPFRLRRNPLARAADVAFTFVMLNAAALVAFSNFVSGRKPAWGR
jgi:cellulose synthase/poly-beta-1,6-N-acetylglucosamine synthase-like glycosyltransferase